MQPPELFYKRAKLFLKFHNTYRKTPVLKSYLKKTPTQMFSYGYCEMLKTSILKNSSELLLLQKLWQLMVQTRCKQSKRKFEGLISVCMDFSDSSIFHLFAYSDCVLGTQL